MKVKPIICVIATIVLVAVAIILLCPHFAATRFVYFDINNGRFKTHWSSCCRVYRERIEETEYSKLLMQVGFQEQQADWRLAYEEQLGIYRRFTHHQNKSFVYGLIAADARMFAMRLDMKEVSPAIKRKLATQMRDLIQKGNPSEVKAFINHLEGDN